MSSSNPCQLVPASASVAWLEVEAANVSLTMEKIFQGSSEQLELDPSLLATSVREPMLAPKPHQSISGQSQQSERSTGDFEPGTLCWPDTQNRRFFKYTEHHLIQDFKLSSCANLLHKWLLLKGPAGHRILGSFEKDFQAFSKQCRGNSYSLRSICRAKSELYKAGLYSQQKGFKVATVTYSGPVTKKKPKKTV